MYGDTRHPTQDMALTKNLQDRYKLRSRDGLYARIAYLESLGLSKPEPDTLMDSDFLTHLDQLHAYLQQPGAQMRGYTLNGTAAAVQVVDSHPTTWTAAERHPTPNSNGTIVNRRPTPDGAALGVVDAIAERVANLLPQLLPPPPVDRWATLADIERFYDHHWQPTTKILCEWLGRRSIKGQTVSAWGFTFERGDRQGRERLWRIRKAD